MRTELELIISEILYIKEQTNDINIQKDFDNECLDNFYIFVYLN